MHACLRACARVYQLQSFLSSASTLRPKVAVQGLTRLFMLTSRWPRFLSAWPATRYSTPDQRHKYHTGVGCCQNGASIMIKRGRKSTSASYLTIDPSKVAHGPHERDKAVGSAKSTLQAASSQGEN